MIHEDLDFAESTEISTISRMLEDSLQNDSEPFSEGPNSDLRIVANQVERLKAILRSGQFTLPIYVRIQTEDQQIMCGILDIEADEKTLTMYTPEGNQTLSIDAVNQVVTFADANRKPVFLNDDMNRTEFSMEIERARKNELFLQAGASMDSHAEPNSQERSSSMPIYSPTTGGSSMSFNAIVTRTPLSFMISAMVIRDLTKHLMGWCASIPEAVFQIHQIGDLTYLSTNSAELLEKYAQYEAPYIAYMIEADLSVDEWEMWDPKQAA